MEPGSVALLAFLIFAAALLYSSVGHAGASGYLAAMALFGLAPEAMKPTALSLNILVAAIAAVMFHRAGCFSWRLFWPFAIGAVPAAFAGGATSIPGEVYTAIVGVVLLYAAVRMLVRPPEAAAAVDPPPPSLAIPLGIGIGFLSGLVGVGGGIFLSPLLLLAGWADARTTSGVSSIFILVNSVSGLLGHYSSVAFLPAEIPVLAAAAAGGGLIGSRYGSSRLTNPAIRRILAAVLVVAGVKMIFT